MLKTLRFLGLSFVILLAACQSPQVPNQSAMDMMEGDERFASFASALQTTGMDAKLDSGELTIFAPSIQAFATYADEQGISLLELFTSPDLANILKYHVVKGKFTAADLSDKTSLTSLQGADIMVEAKSEGVFLNESAKVIEADIEASNAVIHIIDNVLEIPASNPEPSIVDIAVGDERFSILVAALKAADLVDALNADGPFTVFAPTNEAFKNLLAALDVTADELLSNKELLTSVLLYHVVSGEFDSKAVLAETELTSLQGEPIAVNANEAKVNNSKLIALDIKASNGIIHVIDEVLLPPSSQESEPSIVDIVASDPQFSLLLAALKKANLADTLANDGTFTVFAPTDKAFMDLAKALHLEPADLLELYTLKDILLYHVLAEQLSAKDLKPHRSIKTLQGAKIRVSTDGHGNILLNRKVKVITKNIEANNGIIHIIDKVLLPPH